MADHLNKKYNIEIEVLTPLHVGAGTEKDWMKGADYVEDNGKIYIIDHKKIARKISSDSLSSLLINKNDRGLKNILGADISEVSNKIFKSPVSSANDIKVFIKNGLTNKPIVPGSSVKGAIRSILLDYFIEDKNTIDTRDKRFEESIFGTANKGDEFMRFIKIADTQFEETELINTKIFNLFGTATNLNGGWKHEFRGGTDATFKPNGFNTIYEVIKPSGKGVLSISLANKAFQNIDKADKFNISNRDKKRDIVENEITKTLFAIINEHTKSYISKQIEFFEKYANNETGRIVDSLNNILQTIPSNNSSCVLKMSAGSGFHSITGDWQFDDFSINGVNKPNRGPSRGQLNSQDSSKSRKIATDGESFNLMGFVKLTILSEELIAQREQERKAKLEEEQRIEAERIAAEKAEQERIEAEVRAKEEAARKAEEELIAKEKAEQEEKERIIKEKEEELIKAQEANKKRAEGLASEGLTILINIDDFTKGKNIIKEYRKRVSKSIDSSQLDFIKEFVKRCIPKGKSGDWKNVKRGNWKEIKGWVGQETAQQWFNSLIK